MKFFFETLLQNNVKESPLRKGEIGGSSGCDPAGNGICQKFNKTSFYYVNKKSGGCTLILLFCSLFQDCKSK